MSDISAVRSTVDFGAILAAPFRAVAHFLAMLHVAKLRADQFEELNDMSDAELASRGLRREEIIGHVFNSVADA